MHEPVDEGWSNWWRAKPLLGYVETSDATVVDDDPSEAVVVFDLMPQKEGFAFLNAGGDWRVLPESPSLLPSAQLVVTLGKGREKDFTEGTWHEVRLQPDGEHPSELYRDLDVLPAVKTKADILPIAEPLSRSLKEAFSLDKLPHSSDSDIEEVLGELDVKVFAVYDVGQGNANALCRADGVPLLYFDFGGGCLWSTRSYPPRRTPSVPLTFCTRPSVVLSHWDFDHWFSGTKQTLSKGAKWISPNQSFGPRTAKFAASLTATSSLLKWSGRQVTAGGATLVRCTGHSKNDSGIALYANVDGEVVVAPADAEFNHVPIPLHCRKPAAGLVATHHGSRHIGNPVPRPLPDATVAYSYGTPNRYGHPTSAARFTYNRERWTHDLDTPAGHIAIRQLPTPSLPCLGKCTLTLKQS